MYPYVAPHTAKIHTLITLGISIRTKPLVLKTWRRRPCGFDSHRPLHFSLPGVSLRCPRTRLSASPSSHSLDMGATVHLIECFDPRLGPRSFSMVSSGRHRPEGATHDLPLSGNCLVGY